MQVGYKSDVGRQRKRNEDSLVCLRLEAQFYSGMEESGLFVVADGMGGHAAGEIASELAVKIFIKECCLKLLSASENRTRDEAIIAKNAGDILVSSLREVNRKLFERAKESGLQGMGTTLTAALIIGQRLYVINVGDTRCYIINDRDTIRITKDHSIVQELVGAELITPEEVRKHPCKNVLTRVVGCQEDVEPDSFERTLYQGDTILLCSDGLWAALPDEEIAQIVLAAKAPAQACTELVARANEQGGFDNISVIVVKPDYLPSLQESLSAETQVIEFSEATKRKTGRKFLRLFHHKAT